MSHPDLSPSPARRVPGTSSGHADDFESLRSAVEEERRLRHESERKRAEMSDLDDLKSSMTALLCHELRGSLCVIAGFLDLAEEDLREVFDTSTRELMHSAGQQMDRLTNLLQELADFSQIQPLEAHSARRAPLSEILDCVLPGIHLQFDPIGLRLDVELEPETAPCEQYADVTALLLRSLLSNSRRLDPRPAQVVLRSRKLRWTLEIEISNIGAGLPASLRDHLVEGCTWDGLSPHQHGGGLSLGLWIARRAAGLLGGALTVRAQSTPGIHFLVRLPLRPA